MKIKKMWCCPIEIDCSKEIYLRAKNACEVHKCIDAPKCKGMVPYEVTIKKVRGK